VVSIYTPLFYIVLLVTFKFKGNLLLKLQKKPVSAAEAKKCGIFISMGLLLQRTDGGKPIEIHN
jgi:hypothetical protein